MRTLSRELVAEFTSVGFEQGDSGGEELEGSSGRARGKRPGGAEQELVGGIPKDRRCHN